MRLCQGECPEEVRALTTTTTTSAWAAAQRKGCTLASEIQSEAAVIAMGDGTFTAIYALKKNPLLLPY